MVNVEHSITVNLPIDEVFTYVSDLRHSAEWQKGLIEVRKISEGPIGVGTKFAIVRNFLGQKIEAENEFIEYKQNSVVAFKIPSGPMPGEASYLFMSTPEGSQVTSKIEIQTEGFSKLAAPMIAASLKKEMTSNLLVLKDLLEKKNSLNL